MKQMTITFENDNDVIVYALEKVISYARTTQQDFLAQCVWLLASVIGLQHGLFTYINNIQTRTEVGRQITGTGTAPKPREVSAIPRDIKEDPRSNIETVKIHPDRKAQVHCSNDHICDLDLEDTRHKEFGKGTEQFIQQ
jgi:hypothetical protein